MSTVSRGTGRRPPRRERAAGRLSGARAYPARAGADPLPAALVVLAVLVVVVVPVGSAAPGVPCPAQKESPAVVEEQSASSTAVPGTDPEDVAQTWMSDAGATLVRQHTGEQQAEVEISQVRPVHAWAPGFLDGSEPTAAPVPVGSWAAAAAVGEEPVGLVVVEVDEASASVVDDDVVLDGSLAEDVAGLGTSVLVHDVEVAAWYAVEPAGAMTVVALGEVSSTLLAGPISLVDYGQVLRERNGAEPVVSTSQTQVQAGAGGWAVWGPVLAVVAVGVLAVVVTVRHERRVTAPLRQARQRMPLGSDTIPDSHVNHLQD
ncbi:hypothetical protein [Actinomyces sp. 2119]|uniref:hypothetical protein n=1 Tax=Actinomyces sp. 2119 TaxID=2321393 RepID=UPI0015FF3B23|nr:hypothetical protein [Actinomyces sp. 2119]